MDDFAPVVAIIAVFYSLVTIVRIVSEYRLKTRLIEKGMVTENIKLLLNRSTELQPLSSLKWGLVLIGIGAALLLNKIYYMSDQTTFGLMAIFAGVGFLVYSAMAQWRLKKLDENKQ